VVRKRALLGILAAGALCALSFVLGLHVGKRQAQGGGRRPAAGEVAELIQSLPNAAYLPEEYRLPEGVEPGSMIPESKREAVERYHKNIAELSGRFSRLKDFLKEGASVFDYPRIFAKGRIEYDEYREAYRLTLGVYDEIGNAGSQGVLGPYGVLFDARGTILEVKFLVYRH